MLPFLFYFRSYLGLEIIKRDENERKYMQKNSKNDIKNTKILYKLQ